MIVHNGNIVVNNGRWIIPPKEYNVILNQTTGGTISAIPMKGISGTTVSLNNNASLNYEFAGYNITGSTLYDGNKFDINGSDVIVSANWNYIDPFTTVTIGTQTWMKYNLNIDDGGTGIYHRDLTNVNGYNLGTQYYYNYEAAIRVANSIEGFHLPTKEEIHTLLQYDGGWQDKGYKLKSTFAWDNNANGSDIYGFRALPVGMWYYYHNKGEWRFAGSRGDLGGATVDPDYEMDPTGVWGIGIDTENGAINALALQETARPVRLIKDY